MMNMNVSRADLDGQSSPLSASPLQSSLESLAHSAESLAHRAADGTRAQAGHLLDLSSARIQQHPLQSVAIAAGAGAVMFLLLEFAMRGSRGGR